RALGAGILVAARGVVCGAPAIVRPRQPPGKSEAPATDLPLVTDPNAGHAQADEAALGPRRRAPAAARRPALLEFAAAPAAPAVHTPAALLGHVAGIVEKPRLVGFLPPALASPSQRSRR